MNIAVRGLNEFAEFVAFALTIKEESVFLDVRSDLERGLRPVHLDVLLRSIHRAFQASSSPDSTMPASLSISKTGDVSSLSRTARKKGVQLVLGIKPWI